MGAGFKLCARSATLSSTQIATLRKMFDTGPMGLTEVQSGFHLAAIVGATGTNDSHRVFTKRHTQFTVLYKVDVIML